MVVHRLFEMGAGKRKAGGGGGAGAKKSAGGGSGVDFAKIKRKVGRKLPPKANDTATTATAKRIALPSQRLGEQSGIFNNSRM